MSELFVATDLSVVTGNHTKSDVVVGNRVYRRLDPAYYAWLRRRMDRAKGAFDKRRLSPDTWEDLRARFNGVHEVAVEQFGVDSLTRACGRQDEEAYTPPGMGLSQATRRAMEAYIQAASRIDNQAPRGAIEWVRNHTTHGPAIMDLEDQIDRLVDGVGYGASDRSGDRPAHPDPAAGGKEGDPLDSLLDRWVGLYVSAFEQYTQVTGISPPVSGQGERADERIRGYRFPEGAHSELKFKAPVTHHALAQVDHIREEALRAGWSLARLYQNRGRFKFAHGGDYGIICFIGPGEKLGTVTSRTIQLITRSGHSLLFKNHEPTHPSTNPTINQPINDQPTNQGRFE
jgi:hypothetical protein